jgi:predicted glycosyltransferase
MSQIIVSSRIKKRHPNVNDEDVVHAFKSMLRHKQREGDEYIAIGVDSKGRILELVYIYNFEHDFFLVYHALVPPTKKTLSELEMN